MRARLACVAAMAIIVASCGASTHAIAHGSPRSAHALAHRARRLPRPRSSGTGRRRAR